jgi:Ca2+-transporting ATPase
MESLDPQVLRRRISETEIFSRVSPSDKLKIVRGLQGAGAVVAMTGDGINDGPALKAADIGITLGQSGTQVAREVADVVLLDDNIHSLVPAIRDGRRIHDNIRTAIHYISGTNASEVALMLLSLIGGLGQPLNPRQLLWINVLTDVFPELAMAVQAAEADVMRGRPRNANTPVIGARDLARLGRQSGLITAAAFGCYAYGVARYGIGPQASSVAFLGLAATQLLHAFSARSETHTVFHTDPLPPNRFLKASVFGALGALVAGQLIPGLRGLLGTTPVGVIDYLVCGVAATGTLAANEIIKSAGTWYARNPLAQAPVQPLLPAPSSG